MSTPKNSSGSICFAKPHVEPNHSSISPPVVAVTTESPIIAATNGSAGTAGYNRARTITGIAPMQESSTT